jgi:hypothetical protein
MRRVFKATLGGPGNVPTISSDDSSLGTETDSVSSSQAFSIAVSDVLPLVPAQYKRRATVAENYRLAFAGSFACRAAPV